MENKARVIFPLAGYALATVAAYLAAFGAFHTIVVCVWFALGQRARGGVPYGGQRILLAAHSVRRLRSTGPRLR